MILNLARNDVKEYIFGVLDKLATENNVRYFKWDMNRSFSEPGGQKPSRRATQNLGAIRASICTTSWTACAPNIRIWKSNRAPGAAAASISGILQRVDEVWPSDNTDAFDRQRIQEGFSMAYPAKIMSAWVTDVPNQNSRSTPLAYRFLTAMEGALGIGSNLNKFTDADTTLATNMIATYKRIRRYCADGRSVSDLQPAHQ